jgi:hypothetical protein
LAFYYDDYVGTEKPFYKRFMRYPEGETKYEPPRCFSCGGVPRLIHEFIKEEKAAPKHEPKAAGPKPDPASAKPAAEVEG